MSENKFGFLSALQRGMKDTPELRKKFGVAPVDPGRADKIRAEMKAAQVRKAEQEAEVVEKTKIAEAEAAERKKVEDEQKAAEAAESTAAAIHGATKAETPAAPAAFVPKGPQAPKAPVAPQTPSE